MKKDLYVTFIFSFNFDKYIFLLALNYNKEHKYDSYAVYPWSAGLAAVGQNAAAGLDEHSIRDQG